MGGFFSVALAAFVLVIFSWPAEAQQKNAKQQCSFQKCYERCLATGGAGRSNPARGCSMRCTRRGCK